MSECSPSGVDIIYLSRVILISCQQLLRCLTKRTVFLVVTNLRVYLEAVAREERLTSQTVFTPFVFAWKYECK